METNHLIIPLKISDTHSLEPNNKKKTATKERSIGKKKRILTRTTCKSIGTGALRTDYFVRTNVILIEN